MKINLEQFLKDSGVTEAFYPGKRLVVPCQQAGEFKSHSFILDWRDPDRVRFEVKAGISGRDLENKLLKKYPVSFQSPTYVEVEVVNDNDEDEETEGKRGSSDSKGHKKKKKPSALSEMANAFSTMVEGKVPELGEVIEMVVMGMKIAEEAFGAVLETLTAQVSSAKICASELLSKAGDFVTKYTPPAFMEAKGNEQATYNYDREKNADIGFKPSFG